MRADPLTKALAHLPDFTQAQDDALADLRRDNYREALLQGARLQGEAILAICGLAPLTKESKCHEHLICVKASF